MFILFENGFSQHYLLDLSAYPYQPLATFRSDGQYNLVGLGTWDGQPVSKTNMPDYYQRELAATFNFYVDPAALNVLYVQVANVLTTQNTYWLGQSFTNVTLTGLRVTDTDPVMVQGFSNSFANPGQVRAYDPGSGMEATEVLEMTPGHQLNSGINSFSISTSTPGGYNGFTSLVGITGASRIRGGGVFQLTFAPYINVAGFNFSGWNVAAEYGDANQFIDAPPAPLVPEPASLGLLTGVSGLWLLFHHRRNVRTSGPHLSA